MLIKHLALKKLELEVYLYNINMPRKKTSSLVNEQVGIRLSSHEKLCAERMKLIQESINELRKEVKSLREDVSKGKGVVSVLVVLGTIAASVIGFFQFK